MIRQIEFQVGCKLNIWIPEKSDPLRFEPETVRDEILIRSTRPKDKPFSLAMEICRFTGGRYVYGALGVEYEPGEGEARLQIFINECQITHWPSAALAGKDSIWIGILHEYADGIQKSVSAEMGSLPQGTYKFCMGAHGEASSTPNVFGGLANILLASGGNLDAVDQDLARKYFL